MLPLATAEQAQGTTKFSICIVVSLLAKGVLYCFPISDATMKIYCFLFSDLDMGKKKILMLTSHNSEVYIAFHIDVGVKLGERIKIEENPNS